MADNHRKLGDTVRLVGAMMRLRHNTKFKGGGLDWGEAPSRLASPSEHLDFLRLLSRQMEEMRKRQEEQEQERGHELNQQEEMVSEAANFAEAQIRALVNSELEACLVLHESKEFWQQRLDRPAANLLNWIEMGPWTWRTHSRRDCLQHYLRSLSRCRTLLRNKILSAGSLQLHLTQMKQAYMEGTLEEWTVAGLAMIRRTLDTLAVPVMVLDGGGDGDGNSRRSLTLRRSLASALASRDCSPANGRRLTRLSTAGTTASGDESNGVMHQRGQSMSMLRRLLSAGVGRGQEQGRAYEEEEDGQHRRQHQPVGGSTTATRSSSGGLEERNGSSALAASVGNAGSINGIRSPGGVASSSASVTASASPSLWQGLVQQQQHLQQEQQQPEEEEPREAQADFDELMTDAQADTGSGMGIGVGIRTGAGRGRGVMRGLLETSEEVVEAVEMQQKDLVPLLLGRFAAPSRLRRNWMFFAVATPAVLASMVYMYRNRSWMQRSMFRVRGSFWQFVREHISEPFWGIYNELVHNQPLTLTDANALADSSNSLERMLEAFIKDTKPDLSQAEVKKMAMTGDMSVVSREYERSIINAWKNFVAGDIVRMMLIQVQFIKRELLIATTALGQLARENELNLRMMATFPAFLVAWGSFRAVKPVYYWLKSEKSRESTFTAMRTIVLAMERLLNLRHREGTWLQITADHPSEEEDAFQGLVVEPGLVGRRGSLLRPAGYSDNCTREVVVSAGRGQGRMAVRVLDELDLGKLMMLVHQLLRLIRSGPRRFPRRDLVNLQEDLAELVGERGLVSVGQQLRIVQRGKLTNYSRWDSLSLPAHGRLIRTWCSASMGGLDPDDFEPDQATRLIELHSARLGLKFYRGVLDIRVSSQYSQSLLALLEVCWRGPIVGAEDASGSSYGREDWQCDINGAHTAALMKMETVPVFGHMDEVEEFDGHNIEDWTLHILKLDALGEPDVFLNADVTPVFGRNYKRYLDLIDNAPRHRFEPALKNPLCGERESRVFEGIVVKL
eukprot:g16330.t1